MVEPFLLPVIGSLGLAPGQAPLNIVVSPELGRRER